MEWNGCRSGPQKLDPKIPNDRQAQREFHCFGLVEVNRQTLVVSHRPQRLPRAPLNVPPETLATLTTYSWPGNARELENVIERACALATGPNLTPDDLPERVRSNGQTGALIARAREQRMTLRELEKEYIVEALRMTGGNKSRAAEILGIDRRTLHRKLDEYRAEDPSFEL